MNLSDRIEELANLIGCIAEADCMLENHAEDDCGQAQARAAAKILPLFLPVLRAAAEYVEARKAVYGEGAGSLKWNELRTIMHDKHDALVAAVEEAGK